MGHTLRRALTVLWLAGFAALSACAGRPYVHKRQGQRPLRSNVYQRAAAQDGARFLGCPAAELSTVTTGENHVGQYLTVSGCDRELDLWCSCQHMASAVCRRAVCFRAEERRAAPAGGG